MARQKEQMGIDDVVRVKLHQARRADAPVRDDQDEEEPYRMELPDQRLFTREGSHDPEDVGEIVDPREACRKPPAEATEQQE